MTWRSALARAERSAPSALKSAVGTYRNRASTAREEAFDAFAQHTLTVEADCDGLRFLVDTGDRGIGRRLFATRTRPEFDVLQQTLGLLSELGVPVAPQRSVFVDVGANIGTASLAALHRHGFSRAVACEPAPRSRELLRMNAVRNGLEARLMVAGEAITDRAGEAQLALHPGSPGKDHVSDGRAGTATVTVATATLDSVLARFSVAPEDVGLLWVDVQGYEAEVLRGAASIVSLRRPVVFEFWPAALRRRGTLESLQEAVSGYETLIDLRAAGKGARATDIEAVTAAVDALPRATHTDLLAF